MPDPSQLFSLYLRLAAVAQKRQKPYQRDKFLVLVAAQAAELDAWNIAEACRRKVLEHNPGHLLAPFASFRDALQEADLQSYLRRLQRDWPLEKAELVLTHPDVQDIEALNRDDEQLLRALLGFDDLE